MRETEWAKFVAEELAKDKVLSGFNVEVGKKLMYANEIVEYQEKGNIIYHEMSYETDILIYEQKENSSWKPRVVIETKVNGISTHDAITYSQKSTTHKYIHPYLRYGIFIGNHGEHHLPGRLFRHGSHFDFMLSWKNYKPGSEEWETLIDIVKKEVIASQQLEDMIFNSQKRQRKKYYSLHKPLVMKSIK